jgi:hypothetical protein
MKPKHVERLLLVIEAYVGEVRLDLDELRNGDCTLDQFVRRLEARIAALEADLKLP